MLPAEKESNQIEKRESLPQSYPAFLRELKQHIRESQVRASLCVDRELVLLYRGRAGHSGSARTAELGAKIIDRLAADLKKAFRR